jgi:hypothetical protein
MSASAPTSGTGPAIDHNLYSRQLAVFGEAMGKLVQLDVLIIGMKGLGVEIGEPFAVARAPSFHRSRFGRLTISRVVLWASSFPLSLSCSQEPYPGGSQERHDL